MTSEPAATTRGEQTRQAILQAAEQLFLTQGYNGTSMRQIARRAGGIAVGGIYNHFAGKEEIFRALVETRSPYPEVLKTLKSFTGDDGSQLLQEAFVTLQSIMQDHINFIALAMIDFQEFDGGTVRKLANDLIPAVVRFGHEVRDAGGLRDNLDEFGIFRAFISMLLGYTITQVFAYKGSRAMIDGIPEDDGTGARALMLDVFLHGVVDQGNQA